MNDLLARIDRMGDALLPLLARLTFAAVLFMYFWSSALTKLGDGALGWLFPGPGAYGQIFPHAFAAASGNVDNMALWQWAVVVAGTWAEFILPVLIVVGLLTRLAALGMIGFVVVQSLTDIIGHGASGNTLGAWFDRASGALILDQRTLWVFLLMVLVLKGGGRLALDRLIYRPSAARVAGVQP